MDQQLVTCGRGRCAVALAPIACLPLMALAFLAPAPAFAQQAGGIEGTVLEPITTTDQSVGNALGEIFNTKPEGSITRVTVARERAASLRLTVEFDGFDENWLKGQALRAGSSGDPEEITDIVTEPVQLDAGKGTATLEFALSDEVAEGASFTSSRLVLLVGKRAYSRSGATHTYVLQKEWEAATRAENVEVRVFARALQDLGTGFKAAPAPGSRPVIGPSSDEVETEWVQFRAGRPGAYRYVSAVGGGGGAVILSSAAGANETFQIGWIDKEARIVRLRTANGWHLLALRPEGIDARSADPGDPATILQLTYGGDGGYIIHATDPSTQDRVGGAAAAARLSILSRPRTDAAVVRQPVRVPQKTIRANPALRPGGNRASPAAGGSTRDRLTLFHGSGRLETKVPTDSRRGAAFYFVKNPPIPSIEVRPGDGAGPAASPVFDLAAVPVMQGYLSGRTSDAGPRLEDLLGVNSQIWGDVNEASGVYYFVPAGYHLKWDNGTFGLSLVDEAAGNDGDPRVLVRARLAPRITPAQRRAAEILVRQAARAYGRPFFALRPMPIAPDATESTAPQDLARHHDVDDVGVTPPADIMGEVEMSWRMSSVTREAFVELLREDQSVTPQLLLRPASGEAGTLRVPLYVSWAEPASYPAIHWENGSFQRNEAPHPIRLEALHAFVVGRDDRVQLLSWDLTGTAVVPSRARMAMGQELTRPVIDNAFLTWVDYSVAPDDASTEEAVRSIGGGVSETVRQPLEITLFDPLEATGARRLTVFIRSRYFEAGGDRAMLRQFDFDEDGVSESVPFYLGRAEDEVPFEWTVRLTMPDGEVLEGSEFLDGDPGLDLIVSRASLTRIFGDLPGAGSDP